MFKIALCQMAGSKELSTELYKKECMKKAEEMINEACEHDADIVCLPEIWNAPYSNKAFEAYKEEEGGACWKLMERLAKDNGIYLIGGSIPEASDNKIFNTCFIFDREGRQIAKHRKVHLFDINVPGGQVFYESDNLSPGNSTTVFETEFGKMGVIICFDIRFSDFVRKTAIDEGAKLIFIPAAFNMTTGPAHWDLAIRSRAIDNQIFVAACSPARDEEASYVAYGNSAVAGPWGDFKAHADEKETILYSEIDFDEIEKIRGQLPIISSRKADLY